MLKNIILATSIFMSTMAFAQTKELEKINVIGEAEIEISADQVKFDITLTYKDYENVKTAFDQHKKAETELLNFLTNLNIPKKNIKYTLISFNKNVEYLPDGKHREFFATQQNVNVKLEDLNSYADLLIKLVNAGFTNVNTSFTSSKESNFHTDLMEKAILQAKSKAEVMAKVANRKLGKITYISDKPETETIFRAEYALSKTANGDLISEVPQSIKKSLSVNVIFELL
jgi:uncharacterized protein YggE